MFHISIYPCAGRPTSVAKPGMGALAENIAMHVPLEWNSHVEDVAKVQVISFVISFNCRPHHTHLLSTSRSFLRIFPLLHQHNNISLNKNQELLVLELLESRGLKMASKDSEKAKYTSKSWPTRRAQRCVYLAIIIA